MTQAEKVEKYLDQAEKYLLKEIASGHLDLREFGSEMESYWQARKSQPASVWKGASRNAWHLDERARELEKMAQDAVDKVRAKTNPKKTTKLKMPPMPRIRQPAVWSWPVQQILYHAGHDAASSMVEEKYGKLNAWDHEAAIA